MSTGTFRCLASVCSTMATSPDDACHGQERRLRERRLAPAFARGEPLLPVGIRRAELEQLLSMLLGRLIPAGDQIVGATPVERSEALHVDRNHQVGAGERDPHRVAHHRIDRLAQQPEHRIVDARRRRVAHVDRQSPPRRQGS